MITKQKAKVYFCRPQKLIQTYPPVFGKFSRDFYNKNCPDDYTQVLIKFISIDHSLNIDVLYRVFKRTKLITMDHIYLMMNTKGEFF